MTDDGLVEAFIDALGRNQAGTRRVAPSGAAEMVAAIVDSAISASSTADVVGTVALAHDAALIDLGVIGALRERFVVVEPDADGWRDRLPDVAVGVTGAHIAAADLGTMALAAGVGSPRAVSLLPPVHVCVVLATQIVATFAEAVTSVASEPLPSALVWIGGPSRTADLEMRINYGVHGPRAVEVVVVDV